MAVILRERMWVTADNVLLSEPISFLGFRGRAGGQEGWGQVRVGPGWNSPFCQPLAESAHQHIFSLVLELLLDTEGVLISFSPSIMSC